MIILICMMQSMPKCLVSVIQVTHDGNITRHCQISEVVLLLFKYSIL